MIEMKEFLLSPRNGMNGGTRFGGMVGIYSADFIVIQRRTSNRPAFAGGIGGSFEVKVHATSRYLCVD